MDDLDAKLMSAFDHYHNEDYMDGNAEMQCTEEYFRDSMTDCAETNASFEQMVSAAHDFFALDNWMDIVEANYKDQKVLIDH